MTQEVVGDAATKGFGESEQYAWGGKGGLRRYSYTLRHTSDLDVLYLYYIFYFHYFFTAASLVRGGGHTGGSGAGRKGNAHGRKGGTQHPDRSNLHNLTVSLLVTLWPGNTFPLIMTLPLSWPDHTARVHVTTTGRLRSWYR